MEHFAEKLSNLSAGITHDCFGLTIATGANAIKVFTNSMGYLRNSLENKILGDSIDRRQIAREAG